MPFDADDAPFIQGAIGAKPDHRSRDRIRPVGQGHRADGSATPTTSIASGVRQGKCSIDGVRSVSATRTPLRKNCRGILMASRVSRPYLHAYNGTLWLAVVNQEHVLQGRLPAIASQQRLCRVISAG